MSYATYNHKYIGISYIREITCTCTEAVFDAA